MDSQFQQCDEQYKAIYGLLKNSGKLNNEVFEACKALGIDAHKKIPKLGGTRFINHRRRVMKVLVDIWPGLITAFENSLAERKGNNNTKAKVRGLLNKLQSYAFFCKVASYIDILDAAGPVSLIFEGDGVMPYEIAQGVEETCIELDELKVAAGTNEEMLNSYIAKFTYDKDTMAVTGIYLKEGHRRKKPNNRENQMVKIVGMKYSQTARTVAADAKKATIEKLKLLLRERFPEHDSDIYSAMRIYDPQYWQNDPAYGVSEIGTLLEKFAAPLAEAGICEKDVIIEWKKFTSFANRQMGQFLKEPKVLWQIF